MLENLASLRYRPSRIAPTTATYVQRPTVRDCSVQKVVRHNAIIKSQISEEKKKSNLEKLIFVEYMTFGTNLLLKLKRILKFSSLVQSLPLASLYTSLIYITAT